MMFEDIYRAYDFDEMKERIYASTEDDVMRAIQNESLTMDDIHPLFSPAADGFLEDLAMRSHEITRRRFGNAIQMFSPLYISNECTNECRYCGFNSANDIRRMTLTLEQVKSEADILYSAGFRHILLLTGEDRNAVPVEYLAQIGGELHRKFASLSIEVYPMEKDEYLLLAAAGIDGLTLYQETYNRVIYDQVHAAGRKRDFFWRMGGPDRGGEAGFRKIGIGALLGLSDWRTEGFYTALHGLYLTTRYWKSQTLVSFPRLREAPGGFVPPLSVTDRDLTHLVCAIRFILNDAGLVLSTRESAELRDNLIPLGITVMSAGSMTEPGGYSGLNAADGQFAVCDKRDPGQIAAMLRAKGFDPVWKDWDRDFYHKDEIDETGIRAPLV